MRPRHTDTVSSENLVTLATDYRTFLRSLDPYIQTILKPHTLAIAVKRYETCWLPLKRKWPEVHVLPPRDVYWIWHVHMLSPVRYHGDCQELFQVIPDHKFITYSSEVIQRSQEVWNELYPEEKYDLDPKVVSQDFVYQSKCPYDLARAAEREAVYFYNVSLPHMADEVFLKNAVHRYEKLLLLKKNEPDLNFDLLPVFDLDLIWRGHMMRPLLYKKETMNVLGNILDYNSEGLFSLKPSENRVSVLKSWRFHFNDELYIPGCRNRGPGPQHSIHEVPTEQVKAWLDESNLRLKIEEGKFKPEVVLGEKISEVFGPMCLGFVPAEAEIHLDTAEHKVTDSKGSHLFTLRILHTVDVHLSVVQLYHKGELIAMSHVIGHEQLVTAGQVDSSDSCVTIDAMNGERAILVKTTKGDECIVKGGWKGYVPSNNLHKPQAKGRLELSIINLTSNTSDRTFLDVQPFPHDEAPVFNLEGVEINMNSGEIVITNPSEAPAGVLGQLTAALSALIVYILCEPRFEDGPMGIEEIGASNKSQEGSREPDLQDGETDKDRSQGPEFKRRHEMQGCKMLKILGMGKEVPTNNWFFWLFHRRIPEVYCPWDPNRCHRVLAEEMRLAKLEAEKEGPPTQALWLMLISVIILLISVIATVIIVHYDYQLPF